MEVPRNRTGSQIGFLIHSPARSLTGNLLGNLLGDLIDILVPCRCLHCSAVEPGSMHLGLCSRCRRRLVPLAGPGASRHQGACDLCGVTLEAAQARAAARCIPCMGRRSPLDRLFCAFRYQEPLNAAIHGLKFQNLTYIGMQLARELDARLPGELEIDAVVPVPLHWRRRWSRGYNQAVEIARPLARRRGWRLEDVLVRPRLTPPQSGLDRVARLRNLRRAFALRRDLEALETEGKHLLLVDDVYTTGATLEAAAGTLRAAGAGWIGAAVAGRTPGPGTDR